MVANGGQQTIPRAIKRVLDAGDCQNPRAIETCRVIYPATPSDHVTILDPEVAAVITRMLQGVVRSGTGQAAAIGLGAAGKTGTTNDNRDLWFVGYLPNQQLLTTVWLGNDDNRPTSGSSAQAAALWRTYMRQVVN